MVCTNILACGGVTVSGLVGQLQLTLTKGSRGSKAPVTVVPAVAPTKNGVPPCDLAASIAACRADHNHA